MNERSPDSTDAYNALRNAESDLSHRIEELRQEKSRAAESRNFKELIRLSKDLKRLETALTEVQEQISLYDHFEKAE